MLRLSNVFPLRACRLILARERARGATLGIHFVPDASTLSFGECSGARGGVHLNAPVNCHAAGVISDCYSWTNTRSQRGAPAASIISRCVCIRLIFM